MRRMVNNLFLGMLVLVLSACGGSSGGGDPFSGNGGQVDAAVVAALLLIVSNDQLAADGTSPVTITAIATDSDNNVVPDAEVQIKADSGVVQVSDPAITDENGEVEATLTTGGDETNRTITITATSSGKTATETVEVKDVVGGPTAGKIALLASKTSMSGTGSDSVDLTAIVTDSDNVVVAASDVIFTASSGALQVTQGTTDDAGQALATLTTGGDPTNRTITVTARTGTLSATFDVDVVDATTGPAVGKLKLLSSDDQLLSDGSTPVGLTAVVTDSNNIVVEGAQVVFTADSGAVQITQGATDAAGTALANLTTGGDATNRTITINATAGSLTDTITVDVVDNLSGPTFDSLQLLVSSPQLGSSGASDVTVTAIAKDSSNIVIEGVTVAFAADSGALQVTQGTTDAAGQATATLTIGGDLSNRTINLNATAAGNVATNSVEVTGTELKISGESSLTSGDTTVLTIQLTDSDDNPIPGETIAVSSALGNTIAPVSGTTLDTDLSGQVQVDYTADVASGNDTITATALNASGTTDISVSADQFKITSPAKDAELAIDTPHTITVQWLSGGVAQVGKTVNFSTTRGDFNPVTATAVTDVSGNATIDVQSSTSGPALLTAFVTSGPSTSLPVEFVATTPNKIAVQADKTTVGPNDGSLTEQQQSRITATIRDANDNLVKNQVVDFTIQQDTSGGTLTNSTATTDSVGQAGTTFISGASSTATNGVVIRAEVRSNPSITKTILLTVAQQPLFVRLGTSQLIQTQGDTSYRKEFSALVTDSAGNPVENAIVTVRIAPTHYDHGVRIFNGSFWVATSSITGNPTFPDLSCASEDLNQNGILDPGEDQNGNGFLTPGNVASVPATVVTDASGEGIVGIVYTRDKADWVQVDLTATVGATGTESTDIANFVLPALAEDVNQEDVGPPGAISPYGVASNCAGLSFTVNPSSIMADTNVELLLTQSGSPISGESITSSITFGLANTGALDVAATDGATDSNGEFNSSITLVTPGDPGDTATITYTTGSGQTTSVLFTMP